MSTAYDALDGEISDALDHGVAVMEPARAPSVSRRGAPLPPPPPNPLITKAWSRLYCRRAAIVSFSQDNSAITITPMSCKLWSCSICGPRLAARWAGRIADSQPNRFLTLTADPGRFASPQEAANRMKWALPRLFAALRRLCGKLEYALVWELHKSGYPHVHAAIRGVYLPQKLIVKIWDDLGIGSIVDIRPITDARHCASYVAKYMAKSQAVASNALKLTRIIQVSRHFLLVRPMTLDRATRKARRHIYVSAHPAVILSRLIDVFTYQLMSLPTAYAFDLIAPAAGKPIDCPEELTCVWMR